ncbi:hypothetical protein [Actinomadura litoris]|uniref:Uncharacterized protein n=1 Tax=Actinomadura litoris TaxID=2678616 RepID=A0A7K1KUG5_9ACTN|nr:hypothetical protein [Actinomadura litoris]MUN35675.1 hypothetical protein [Actinomadura litoris]
MDWTAISELSMKFETGEQEYTFTGPRHSIGLIISLQPARDDGESAVVPVDTLIKNSTLIDYIDRSPLPESSQDYKWSYTKKNLRSYGTDGGTPQFKFRLYPPIDGRTPTAKTLGIRVRTESGKDIFSSQDGAFFKWVRGTIRWD